MFPCTKCGACCKRAGATGLMPSKADGSCIYLNTDNTCSVYNKRPDICSIDKMYKKRQLLMSKKEYYKLSAKICNQYTIISVNLPLTSSLCDLCPKV